MLREATLGDLYGERAGEISRLDGLLEAERHAEVIELAEAGLREDPDWLPGYAYAGIAYARSGETARAIERLRVVRERAPDAPQFRVANLVLEMLE